MAAAKAKIEANRVAIPKAQADAFLDGMLALKRVRPFLNAPEAYTKEERDKLNEEVGRILKIVARETER